VKNLNIDEEGRFVTGKYNRSQVRVILKVPIESKNN
jgi:hypothetical protein